LTAHEDFTEYWRIRYAGIIIRDMSKHIMVKDGRNYYNQYATVISQTVNWYYD